MTAINSNRAIRGPVTAVPVVAGKGVRLVADTENNRWVVEADETVLWEDTVSQETCSTFTLSEYASNFERLRFYGYSYADTPVMYECPAPNEPVMPLSVTYVYFCAGADKNPSQCRQSNYTTTDGLLFNVANHRFVYGTDARYTTGGNTTNGAPIYKIVGINRIASN